MSERTNPTIIKCAEKLLDKDPEVAKWLIQAGALMGDELGRQLVSALMDGEDK